MEGQLYNCKDLIMRCNINEPFSGAIDDGKGTIAYVNTEVLVKENTVGSCVYYEKRIKLRIDKVTHIVRNGDSLWAIAKKLNVSVDEIAKSNRVEDVNLIKVGDVLDINVDIRYGYQVSGMVDTLCFSPQAREYGYTPLSEREWYKVIGNVNSIVDNIGSSLASNSGKARVGSNFHVYVENPSGRVFQGNQYVTTRGLKDIGKSIIKYTQPKIGRLGVPLAIAFEGVEIYDGWEQDGRNFGHNTVKQTMGGASNILTSSAACLAAGATIKATISLFAAKYGVLGSVAGPIGTIAGIIIGAVVGYYVGEAVESSVEYLYDTQITNSTLHEENKY